MAFTASQGLMLPATVTGSGPRPRWYTMNLSARPLDTAMMDPRLWRIAQQGAASGYDTTAIPQARKIVLRELGLEERWVAAADEKLGWEMLPDHERHTHLEPLRV